MSNDVDTKHGIHANNEVDIDVDVPVIQKIIAVLWPSFLTSGIATIFVFTAFDPIVVLMASGYESVSRLGGYTIGFFLFWILTASTCALTCYFIRPCK